MNTENISEAKYRRAAIEKRRAEVRRQKLILSSVLIAAILLVSLITGARLTFAKGGGKGIQRVKYYKSVMIGRGDTIETVACDNYTGDWKDTSSFIHEVNMINHLDDDEELIAGNYLTIPYYIDVTAE